MDWARVGHEDATAAEPTEVHIDGERYFVTRSGAVVDARARPQPAQVRLAVYRAVAEQRIGAGQGGECTGGAAGARKGKEMHRL